MIPGNTALVDTWFLPFYECLQRWVVFLGAAKMANRKLFVFQIYKNIIFWRSALTGKNDKDRSAEIGRRSTCQPRQA